jgi:hypothetical protein
MILASASFAVFANWTVFAERYRLTLIDRVVYRELSVYAFLAGATVAVVAGCGGLHDRRE